MAERSDAEFLEVVVAQRSQDLLIDGVLRKRRRVLLESSLGEPSSDVEVDARAHGAPCHDTTVAGIWEIRA